MSFKLLFYYRSHTLATIIKAIPVDENTFIPFEELNWETVSLWRILTDYLKERNEFDDVLDKILPDLVDFCEYIQKYCKSRRKPETDTDFLEQNFILEQLLIIASGYDISDVVVRRTLMKTISDLLQNNDLSPQAINIGVLILKNCIVNIDRLCGFVCELISEIKYPSETETATRLHDELFELKDRYQTTNLELITNTNAEDYLAAAEQQQKLTELQVLIKSKENELNTVNEMKVNSDPDTIKKYLNITAALLALPDITELTPNLISLKENVVQDCLIHPDEEIKTIALMCYVLCCLVDEATAKTGIHICAIPVSYFKNMYFFKYIIVRFLDY